jgi:branched-chain amino acid transport system substrate-binding protein
MNAQGVPDAQWGDPHSAAAYATLELFRKAMTADARALPDEPTRDDVIKAYGKTVRNETLGGLLPQPVTFRPGKPNGLIDCYWFGSYESGQFKDGDLAKPVCDPPALRTPNAA